MITTYAAITTIIIYSIFEARIFPECFIEGAWLTLFKKCSEYIICLILLFDMYLLKKHRAYFNEKVYNYLSWSIAFTILSELAFTFYISNYGISNLIGHYLKIFSFYLVYKAIVEIGIREPSEIIFKELKDKQKALEKLSFRDPLTNLLNRRSFLEILEYEQAKTQRNSTLNSIIIADIDNFKKVNDNHGHDVGDKILEMVADIFRQNIRHQDSVCRWGGEEFLFLLPECGIETAGEVAEKLRRLVEEHSFKAQSLSLQCTISFGVAQLQKDRPFQESVRIADAHLYKSKAAGKNRVTLAPCPAQA
ncbi:MAG: GGDEF domain-containing protein [Syntrophotaleaceae bacterium]